MTPSEVPQTILWKDPSKSLILLVSCKFITEKGHIRKVQIPQEVKNILEKLQEAGYKGYIVGGCVRDLLMKNPPAGGPKDWDVTTNAKPEEIQKIFPDNVYENTFGTVGVKTPHQANPLTAIKKRGGLGAGQASPIFLSLQHLLR